MFQKTVAEQRRAEKPLPVPEEAEPPEFVSAMIETLGAKAHSNAFSGSSSSHFRSDSRYPLHSAHWKPSAQEFAQARGSAGQEASWWACLFLQLYRYIIVRIMEILQYVSVILEKCFSHFFAVYTFSFRYT